MLEYFVKNEMSRENSFLGKIDIATSEELYDYVFNVLLSDRLDSSLADEFMAYNFILLDTDLQ